MTYFFVKIDSKFKKNIATCIGINIKSKIYAGLIISHAELILRSFQISCNRAGRGQGGRNSSAQWYHSKKSIRGWSLQGSRKSYLHHWLRKQRQG
jgi:hypothetical protein